MKDNRLGAIALIIGAVSGIVTLTFHPSGVHRIESAQLESLISVLIAVHALAIAGLPFAFIGAMTLSRRIDSPARLGVLALVIYGFSLVAVMSAATVSGLVTPDILRHMVAHDAGSEQWHAFMVYNHAVNQAFAKVYTIGSASAVILWSLALMKRRPLPLVLGIYGLVLGLTVIIALVSGSLSLEVYGTRLVTFAQAIWFILAAVLLWRSKTTSEPEIALN